MSFDNLPPDCYFVVLYPFRIVRKSSGAIFERASKQIKKLVNWRGTKVWFLILLHQRSQVDKGYLTLVTGICIGILTATGPLLCT